VPAQPQTNLASDVPALGPTKLVLIHEHTHELRDGNRRVRIIQLERDLC
jgi:hypothetical protein